MTKIEEMRKRILERNNKKNSGGNKGSRDMFPFWNMDIDQSSRVRLIPDANPDNPDIFFVSKYEHKIHIDGKLRTVICRETYGEKCPICELSQKHYKADKAQGNQKSIKGKYYWRDKTAVARVLVLDTPLVPEKDESGEGPDTYIGGVFKTQFGYQILQKIDEQILSKDDPLEVLPWELDMGYDFIIKKSKQAGSDYGNYQAGSTFARSPSPVPAKYRDSIELVDLATYLPEDPGYEAVQALLNQHLASADGSEGTSTGDDDNSTTGTVAQRLAARVNAAKETATTVAKTESEPKVDKSEDPASAESDEDDEDGLAAIKAILAKKQAAKG